MKTKIAALAAVLIIASCNNKSGEYQNLAVETQSVDKSLADNEEQENGAGYFSADSTQPAPPGTDQKQKQPVSKTQSSNPDWDKKIIKTAALNFEVKDYKAYSSSLREKVRTVGGYIAQENENQSEYQVENTVVIKVPVEQFDNALSVLTGGIDKLNEKKITSQDVTAEYVDTRSRLEAKKQVRQRYLGLLSQAKNMEEILNVQSEINDIQEEIESAAGRINYLSHSAAYSTINATFYQVLNVSAKDDGRPSFGERIGAAFRSGWGWVGELFVGLISIWPLLLITIAVIAYFKRPLNKKVKQADA